MGIVSGDSSKYNLIFPESRVKELGSALLTGNLVVFAGAGLSKPAGLPSWIELVKTGMPRHLEGLGKQEAAVAIKGLPAQFLLQAADIWWQAVEVAQDRFTFLDNVFNPKSLNVQKNHELIAKLKLPFLLTTNYDKLFETAFGPAVAVKTHLDNDVQFYAQQRKNLFIRFMGTLITLILLS